MIKSIGNFLLRVMYKILWGMKSIFWDDKANQLSASRIVMIGSYAITVYIAFWFMHIVEDFYLKNGKFPDIPNLDLLIAIIGGQGVAGNLGYAANKWSSRGVKAELEEGASEGGSPDHEGGTPIEEGDESDPESNDEEINEVDKIIKNPEYKEGD